MSQGSLNQNIRFLSQKVCPVDRQTRKWLLWTPFQGFRSFSFNLKDRPNITEYFDGHLGSDVIEKRARRQ